MANKITLAVRLVRTREIKVGGIPYRMPGYLLNPLWLAQGGADYEPWLDNVFGAAFRCREGAFLDVGANIGQTMLKVLAIDRSRQYVGFEPQVMCSAIVQKFIQDNGLTKHTILPIGLSTENKTVKLLMREGDFDSTASIVESFRPDSFYKGHRYVCVRNGDAVAAELHLDSVAVIKIDVEGAELEVIEGLANSIQKHQPFVVFEVLNFYLAVTNEALAEPTVRFRKDRLEKLESILRSFGYEIYRIVPSGPKAVAKIQPESTADLTQANYIAVPSDSRDRFLREIQNMGARGH